jgi:hypothetical protein
MAHYNYIRVKQNLHLICLHFVIPFHLILSYIISWYLYILIIAVMCFVDHNGIKNDGDNSETCQDDIIAGLFKNIVFISYTKTMLIYTTVQMTIIDLVVLGCTPWHSAAFQGTRLHSKAFSSIPRHSAKFIWTQLRLG